MLRVALTRAKEDIQKDKALFEGEGFQVVELPLIKEVALRFEVPEVKFDFVVFQSPRAVRLFLSRHRLSDEKIVAVGEKTKRAVESEGYKVWAVPEEYYSGAIVELFRGKRGRVLIPRSAIGRDEVVEGLKALGLEVFPLEVYTVEPVLYEESELVDKLKPCHAVVFASPSAVKGLVANLPKERAISLLEGKRLVCIGKTTKEVLNSLLGVECLMPEKPTMEKVVELLKSLA